MNKSGDDWRTQCWQEASKYSSYIELRRDRWTFSHTWRYPASSVEHSITHINKNVSVDGIW